MHPLKTTGQELGISSHSNGPVRVFFNGNHVANSRHKLQRNVLSTVFKMQICSVGKFMNLGYYFFLKSMVAKGFVI